jgi:hypothetical protein
VDDVIDFGGARRHPRAMHLPLDNLLLGQIAGFLALALCVAAVMSKDDDRLLAVLILGNIAFAVQFAFFGAWVASAISALIILRIYLARRFPRHLGAALTMVLATIAVAAATWQGLPDIFPLAAGIVGTIAMFMFRGIPMRLGLVFAGLCWIITNALIGSIGALAAETLILLTNLTTIIRLARARHRKMASAVAPDL